jgi:hypothetical protein
MIFDFLAWASLLMGANAIEESQPRPGPAAAPAPARLREAEQAMAGLDLERILSDRPHAEAMLSHLDVLLAAPGMEAQRRLALMAAYPETDLIGPMTNFAGLLWQAGRPQESLTYIQRLEPLAAEHANEYGRMWVTGHATCANAALGRNSEAATALRRLQAQPKINAAAHNMALLCMGDLDASERLVIQRLESGDPADMLLSLQRYQLETSEGPGLDAVRKRLNEVRERPAVRAAIERIGRTLTLPIDRTYYGSF